MVEKGAAHYKPGFGARWACLAELILLPFEVCSASSQQYYKLKLGAQTANLLMVAIIYVPKSSTMSRKKTKKKTAAAAAVACYPHFFLSLFTESLIVTVPPRHIFIPLGRFHLFLFSASE